MGLEKIPADVNGDYKSLRTSQTGYHKTDKLLTPKQVALIAHYLGEP